LYKAFSPTATLLDPELFAKAFNPSATLWSPELIRSAPNPTAVLFLFAFGCGCELSVPRVVFPLTSLTTGPFNWLKLINDIILLHN
jgi:hypothetical protein